MNESNREGRSSISGASTVEEIGEFWDSHSLAEYAEETTEVSVDLRARRRITPAPDPDPEPYPGSKQKL